MTTMLVLVKVRKVARLGRPASGNWKNLVRKERVAAWLCNIWELYMGEIGELEYCQLGFHVLGLANLQR